MLQSFSSSFCCSPSCSPSSTEKFICAPKRLPHLFAKFWFLFCSPFFFVGPCGCLAAFYFSFLLFVRWFSATHLLLLTIFTPHSYVFIPKACLRICACREYKQTNRQTFRPTKSPLQIEKKNVVGKTINGKCIAAF